MNSSLLPIPEFFDPGAVGAVWRIPYEERARQARDWARQHGMQPVSVDSTRTWLMLIDVQNTFCIPDFELYVGGRSGRGAVEDNVRLCEFIYRNLGNITQITATMDTHMTMQVFHAIFFVDKDGNHPTPYTDIHASELQRRQVDVQPCAGLPIRYCPRIRPADDGPLCRELEKRESTR